MAKIYQIAFELAGKIASSFSDAMGGATNQLQRMSQAMAEIKRKQDMIAAFRRMQQAVSNSEAALLEARRRVIDLSNAMSASGAPTAEMIRDFERARQRSQQLADRLGRQREELHQLDEQMRQNGIDSDRLSEENERLARSYERVAASQRRMQEMLLRQQEIMSQRADYRGQMFDTAAMGAIALSPVAAFAKGEEASTELKVAMMMSDGTVSEDFAKINQLATDMGNTLPGTTEQFVRMMTMLKRQGISNESILGGMGKATAYLGVMLKKTSEDAAEFVAKLQDATSTSEKDMLALTDTIQRAFYLGVDDTNMLSFFTKLSPVMAMVKQQGLDFTKTMAPIGVMMDQAGMIGESAGNALRKVIQTGFDVGKIGKANKSYNVSLKFTNAKGEFAGLENMFKQLEKLKTLSTEKRTMYLKDAFGDDAETQQVIAVLMNKGIAGYQETVQKMEQQADIQKRIDLKLTTLTQTWEAFTGTLSNILGTIGEPIAQNILPILQAVSAWTGSTLAPWVEDHKELVGVIGTTVVALIAFKAATVTIGFVWTFVKGAMISARVAMFALSNSIIGIRIGLMALAAWQGIVTAAQWAWNAAMTANPIGLIIVAIGALVAAGVALYMHWDTVKAKFLEVWQGISDWFASLSIYQDAVNIVNGFINGLAFGWDSVMLKVNELWAGLVGWFHGFSLFESGQKLITTFADGIVSAKDIAVEKFSNVLGAMRQYMPFSDAKEGPLSQLTESGRKVVETFGQGIAQGGDISDVFANALNIPQIQIPMPSIPQIPMPQVQIPNIPQIPMPSIPQLKNLSEIAEVIPKTATEPSKKNDTTQSFGVGLSSVASGLTDNSTTKSINISFAPNITVNGSGGSGVVEDVKQGISAGFDDFQSMMKRAFQNERRLSYG